jgi:tripartite-type tricarboxylate transporter receptor subunit TctC
MYADRAIYDRLVAAGINPVSSTPAEFDTFFRKEAARWAKVFKESGIKLN